MACDKKSQDDASADRSSIWRRRCSSLEDAEADEENAEVHGDAEVGCPWILGTDLWIILGFGNFLLLIDLRAHHTRLFPDIQIIRFNGRYASSRPWGPFVAPLMVERSSRDINVIDE